jgi:hypothetical protein
MIDASCPAEPAPEGRARRFFINDLNGPLHRRQSDAKADNLPRFQRP